MTDYSSTSVPEQPLLVNATEPKQGTRIGAVWLSLGIFVLVLLLLMIFILQNSMPVHIHYLGLKGTLVFGVAILLAAVSGSILTLLIGTARIVQLKHSRKHRKNI